MSSVTSTGVHSVHTVPGGTWATMLQVVGVIAHAGDASMGQPTGHSCRTALCAAEIAAGLGLDDEHQRDAAMVALMRWSGCSANASGFAEVLGDDIRGRSELLAGDEERRGQLHLAGETGVLHVLAATHCDVAQRLAAGLGLGRDTVAALAQVLERWDGRGVPRGVVGEAIAMPARIVSVASVVEISLRELGPDGATAALHAASGLDLDPDIVNVAISLLGSLEQLATIEPWATVERRWERAEVLLDDRLDHALRLVGDVADAKSIHRLGFSRRVERLAVGTAAAAAENIDADDVGRAALVHRLGRVAVSSRALDQPGRLLAEHWDQIRMWPYFTEQALARAPGLSKVARIAGAVQERLDGSGYPRGARADRRGAEHQILAAASGYAAMTSARPDRSALEPGLAFELLRRQADSGQLDRRIVDLVVAVAAGRVTARHATSMPASLLSPREIDVLALVANGSTNNQIADRLSITPKTVNTHLERSFAKLGVSTRTAAVMAAFQAGELEP